MRSDRMCHVVYVIMGVREGVVFHPGTDVGVVVGGRWKTAANFVF